MTGESRWMARAIHRLEATRAVVLAKAAGTLAVIDDLAGEVHRVRLVDASWLGKPRYTADYANTFYPDGASEFMIGDLHVEERLRRRGRGSLLLTACLELARRKNATVVYGNLSGIDDVPRLEAFYAHRGFTVERFDGNVGSMMGRVVMRLSERG